MQPTEADQKPEFTTDSILPGQPVMQDEGNIHGHEINEERLTVSIRAPLREHHQIIQRQQYYTGDA